MSRAELELQQMILGTSLVQPVSAGSKGGSVWVLSRQLAGQETPWLKVVDDLLAIAEEQEVSVHVCRRYVRKNGKMVFGWHIGITSKGLKEVITDISKVKPAFDAAKPNLDDAPEPTGRVKNPTRSAVVTNAPTQTYEVPPAQGKSKLLPQGTLKLTRLGKDENGDEMTIEEMPLPHVTHELNVPKHDFGRGARYTSAERGFKVK